ncbi:uncharacterized protein PG998_008742 [Apiospora kogelbergensis]|uniref:uncharacterized protein n=1 Tax=Apiospora kogelbergensis TaxID=1337665 RepID=UPI00312E37A0
MHLPAALPLLLVAAPRDPARVADASTAAEPSRGPAEAADRLQQEPHQEPPPPHQPDPDPDQEPQPQAPPPEARRLLRARPAPRMRTGEEGRVRQLRRLRGGPRLRVVLPLRLGAGVAAGCGVLQLDHGADVR